MLEIGTEINQLARSGVVVACLAELEARMGPGGGPRRAERQSSDGLGRL